MSSSGRDFSSTGSSSSSSGNSISNCCSSIGNIILIGNDSTRHHTTQPLFVADAKRCSKG